MGGSSSPHLSRNDIKKAKSTCRKGRRKVFIFCWEERFIPSSCIRKRDKTGRKIIQRVIERNFRRHCIFIETLTVSRKLTFTNRAILLLPSSLYTHIYISNLVYTSMFSQKSVLMSGTSFIIRTGNSSMNLRRTVLFGERIIYKRKKENCAEDRNSNSISISREDIERV